jgi:mannitol operon transcriptional antiterminator
LCSCTEKFSGITFSEGASEAMILLTVQQKQILHHLLTDNSPIAMAELARQTNLTTRQVNYRLKSIKSWLAQRDVNLNATPNVGIKVVCSLAQRQKLLQELALQSEPHLVLSAGQRQQLLALVLLLADEPLILNRLQYISATSRTTILKDLEPISDWARVFRLTLVRKPNFGIIFDGLESDRRQALVSLLWGDTPFIQTSLISVTFDTGLKFSLENTSTSLPIILQINQILDGLSTGVAFGWVAFAEAQLGGRFTDDAVLHLSLAFAIQQWRIQAGHYSEVETDSMQWLTDQKVWSVAVGVTQLMQSHSPVSAFPVAEIVEIAMYLLAGVRDERWPGDLEIDPALTDLIDMLVEEVALAFSTPGLRHDIPLRDGLISHIIPAILRQRFNLWSPPRWSDGDIVRQLPQEYQIASELALLVTEHTEVVLPDNEIDTLALLLRAAFVRERPNYPRRVYIICPSGMATAQLLLARLRARFPSLEILGVLSMRELSTKQITNAQLLISTVPLESPRRNLPVIQVHPLLTVADIEAITNWLTTVTG